MKSIIQKTKYFGQSDLDGGVHFEVFKRNGLTKEQVKNWLDENRCLRPRYGGIARFFSGIGTVTINKNKVLIEQMWGWDC